MHLQEPLAVLSPRVEMPSILPVCIVPSPRMDAYQEVVRRERSQEAVDLFDVFFFGSENLSYPIGLIRKRIGALDVPSPDQHYSWMRRRVSSMIEVFFGQGFVVGPCKQANL